MTTAIKIDVHHHIFPKWTFDTSLKRIKKTGKRSYTFIPPVRDLSMMLNWICRRHILIHHICNPCCKIDTISNINDC